MLGIEKTLKQKQSGKILICGSYRPLFNLGFYELRVIMIQVNYFLIK